MGDRAGLFRRSTLKKVASLFVVLAVMSVSISRKHDLL